MQRSSITANTTDNEVFVVKPVTQSNTRNSIQSAVLHKSQLAMLSVMVE